MTTLLPKNSPPLPHDNSYKLLFSHQEMVRDLLVGFIHEPWVAELDLDTLEKVNGTYITDDLRDREDDIIWRVRFQGQWLYLYLLIEFQSSVDNYMAVRILTYLGLLYQDLIKQKLVSGNQKLPPVLPIVLYNGKPRWRAATEIADLIVTPPGQLRDYQPRLKYLLLDELAIDESAPWELKNLVAALFRLEKSKNAQTIEEIVTALIQWLNAPEQNSLRNAFTVWIKRALLPAHFAGVTFPEVNNLLEMKSMLSETVTEWTQQWLNEGIIKGMNEGIIKGMNEGIIKGMNEGIIKGMNEGIIKGRNEGMNEGIIKGKLEGKFEGKTEAKRESLERLLTKRFGQLSPAIKEKLLTAPLEQLDIWFDCAIDSPDLNSVFTHN